jgi:hypothetical protein
MTRKKIATPESESSDSEWDEREDNTTSDETNSEESDHTETSEEKPVRKKTNKSRKPLTPVYTSSDEESSDGTSSDGTSSDETSSDESSSDENDSESSEEELIPRITVKARRSAPARISTLSTKDSNEIFKELIKNQIPNVPAKWKLNINDMKRICKYVDRSIFDPDSCCLWKGYITNVNNLSKGTYVNFYFRNRKVALHRLLYSNFVAPLDETEYLKFNCEHKGVCCNVNHYERYRYSKNSSFTREPKKEPKKENKDTFVIGTDNPNDLIVDFD